MVAAFHLAEETFPLHLFLQRFQRLIDVVVAHHDLNDVTLSIMNRPQQSRTIANRPLNAPIRRRETT